MELWCSPCDRRAVVAAFALELAGYPGSGEPVSAFKRLAPTERDAIFADGVYGTVEREFC